MFLPCIFNVKIFNFFWSTFLGIIPSLFLLISIGSGLEKIIDQNLEAPSIIDLITSPSIYSFDCFFYFINNYTILLEIYFIKINLVLPPCTDQGTSHYQ